MRTETLTFLKKEGKSYLYVNQWATGYQILEFSSHEAARACAETGANRGYLIPAESVVTYKGPAKEVAA